MKNKILSFSEIDKLAVIMSKKLKKGGVLGLIGELGTGKTTFSKRICAEYGVKENVKSPTFTYVIEYNSGSTKVYHFDAYRITAPEEIYEIGFEDYIGEKDAAVIVEWADNIIYEMPKDTIFIEILHNDEETRKLSVYKIENGEKKYVDFSFDNDN